MDGWMGWEAGGTPASERGKGKGLGLWPGYQQGAGPAAREEEAEAFGCALAVVGRSLGKEMPLPSPQRQAEEEAKAPFGGV